MAVSPTVGSSGLKERAYRRGGFRGRGRVYIPGGRRWRCDDARVGCNGQKESVLPLETV